MERNNSASQNSQRVVELKKKKKKNEPSGFTIPVISATGPVTVPLLTVATPLLLLHPCVSHLLCSLYAQTVFIWNILFLCFLLIKCCQSVHFVSELLCLCLNCSVSQKHFQKIMSYDKQNERTQTVPESNTNKHQGGMPVLCKKLFRL
jgi:hypothetical protein